MVSPFGCTGFEFLKPVFFSLCPKNHLGTWDVSQKLIYMCLAAQTVQFINLIDRELWRVGAV